MAHMQAVDELGHAKETDTNTSVVCVDRVQQMVEYFVASVSEVQKLLDNLHVKISAPAKWLRMSHDDYVGVLLGSRGPM